MQLHKIDWTVLSHQLVFCSHQLLINPSKTKLIFFGTRQLLSKISDIRVAFLDQELTPVSSVKDLGITLDSYLNSNDQQLVNFFEFSYF